MNFNASYTIPDSVMLQNIDDETLLLDTNTQEFFSLNEIGSAMWESMSEYNNLEEVYKEFQEAFDIDANQLKSDITTFASALKEKGLITFND